MKNSICEKLFGIKFDYQLTFDQHVKILYKKANAKLKVFAQAVWYMGKKAKKKSKMNSFFAAQINYCLLIWMIHSCLIIAELNIYIKYVVNWYRAIKTLRMKKYWKKMEKSVLIIKTFTNLQLKCPCDCFWYVFVLDGKS